MTEQRPTADNSEQRDAGRAMLAVFSALDFIRHEGITPASAQALLAIAIQTTRDATPRIATPSAIAERLGIAYRLSAACFRSSSRKVVQSCSRAIRLCSLGGAKLML